jgi:hypothetical protein
VAVAQYALSSSGVYSSGPPKSVHVLLVASVPFDEAYVGRMIGIVGMGAVIVLMVVLALYATGDFVGVATGLGVLNDSTVNSASNFVSDEDIGSAGEVVEWTSVYTRISEAGDSVEVSMTAGEDIDSGSAAGVVVVA